MFKSVIAIAVMAAAGIASAAGTPTAQPAIPAAKQKLVQRVLQLWPAEAIGQSMLQAPVANAVAQSRVMLQGRAPVERRDAALKDITDDAKKFLDETTPVVKASTQKLIPVTIAPLLAERFTEDELRQIIAMLESPVKQKFEALVPEMQKTLGEKVADETRPTVEPKLKDLQQRIGMRLRTAVSP